MKLPCIRRPAKSFGFTGIVLLVGLTFLPAHRAGAINGHLLQAVGPANEGTGGAGTAGNARDVIGSIYWNPATGLLFDRPEIGVGIGALFPKVEVSSSVSALDLEGRDTSEVGFVPLSSIAAVVPSESGRSAWHFLFAGEAGLGFKVDEQDDNPIFSPQAGAPDNAYGGAFGGLGWVKSQYELLRTGLGVSYGINDRLAVGASLAPSFARLQLSPAAFAAPDDANRDGIPSYPTVGDHAFAAGIGFQVGARWQAGERVALAASLTSPTWFTDFEWDVEDERGRNRTVEFRVDRPLSISLGTSIQLAGDTTLYADARWIHYSGTEGFEGEGFNDDGSIAGLGWDDMWVAAVGIEQGVGERLVLRAGYNYGSNPIPFENTFYNIPAGVHASHHLSVGVGWAASDRLSLNLAYSHEFNHAQSGRWQSPAGSVPGTKVETTLLIHSVSLGFSYRF